MIVVSIVAFFLLALIMRMMIEDKVNFPMPLIWIASVLIAVPVVFVAYSILRDQDLGSFLGNELIWRVAAVSLIYAGLWMAMPVMKYSGSADGSHSGHSM